ncbi:MAG: hypothetical protein ABIO24_06090 [Saprospiraceae bacterium]
MRILPSTPADLETIFQLYDAAIAHQKTVSHLHWLPFERDRVAAEIEEGRQWKILIDGEVAGIFLIAFPTRLSGWKKIRIRLFTCTASSPIPVSGGKTWWRKS